jgi:hypothetical protein
LTQNQSGATPWEFESPPRHMNEILENLNPKIELANENDIAGILRLQKENLGKNLSENEKQQ